MADPGARLPPMIPVVNETKNSKSRIARNGKVYTYKVEVIQQPERARACGSGVKSSADRRPVDPPPIVQLRILEGNPDHGEQTDVTLSMNANYFLFATLDYARPIPENCVVQPPMKLEGDQSDATSNVLTGSPVAGMVFLDRPRPAGYFIFSDLSVRHEGTYRVCFHLYEMLKNPDDDTDLGRLPHSLGPHVNHRIEVKSAPFMTYSAKKFPGLAESTSLSRTVAEQGCRVRIRRDVRIRRPTDTPKQPAKDWNRHADENQPANSSGDYDAGVNRGRPTGTPNSTSFPSLPLQPPLVPGADGLTRARSSSRESRLSMGLSLGPVPSLSRRTSLGDMTQPFNSSWGYQQTKPGPAHYQNSPSLQYTSGPYTAPQHPNAASMQPPSGPYHHPYHQGQHLPPLAPQPHQSYNSNYGYFPSSGTSSPHPFSSSYALPPPSSASPLGHPTSDESRRSSNSLSLPAPQPPPASPSAGYGQPSMSNHAYGGPVTLPPPGPPTPAQAYQHHIPPPPALPPTQPGHNNSYPPIDNGYNMRPAPTEPPIGQYPASRSQVDKLPSITHLNNHTAASRPPEYSVSPHTSAYPSIEVPSPHQPPPSHGAQLNPNPLKRSYDMVFPEHAQNQHMTQLRNGARPTSPTPPPYSHPHHSHYTPSPAIGYHHQNHATEPHFHQIPPVPAGFPDLYHHEQHHQHHSTPGPGVVHEASRSDVAKYEIPTATGHASAAVGTVQVAGEMLPVSSGLSDVGSSISNVGDGECLNYKRSNGHLVTRTLPPYE